MLLQSIDELLKYAESNKTEDAFIKIKGYVYFEDFNAKITVHNYDKDKREVLRNTVEFIIERFEDIYKNSILSILPRVSEIVMYNFKTDEKINTFDGLNDAFYKAFDIQINCADIENGYMYYSYILKFYPEYGINNEFEMIMHRDKPIYWDNTCSGNLFSFREYEDSKNYLGKH